MSSMSTYHFGVPKKAVWLSHILLGIYFIILGYTLIDTNRIHGLILLVLGALQSLYHSHIWFNHAMGYEKH
jgi:hypothetical protein